MINTRRFQRFTTNLEAHFFLKGEKRGWKNCAVTTLGCGGVGIKFQHFEKVEVDSDLLLEIFSHEECDPVGVKGMIRWVKREGCYFIIGIEVTSESDQDKLAYLIKPLQIQRKRRCPRFASKQKAQYCIQERYGSWKECTIHTISLKGVGITLKEKINIGSLIFLEIPMPLEFAPLSIKGALRWIKEKENDFVGGIEFTKVLDEVEFSKLG
jgi:hypothetical protein